MFTPTSEPQFDHDAFNRCYFYSQASALNGAGDMVALAGAYNIAATAVAPGAVATLPIGSGLAGIGLIASWSGAVGMAAFGDYESLGKQAAGVVVEQSLGPVSAAAATLLDPLLPDLSDVGNPCEKN